MTNFDWQFPYTSQRMPVLARNAVSTSQPLAAQAGLRMLLKGGNAVDAALATAITLTVVEPTSNGIGSDAFCILWDGKKLHGLNASGRSPRVGRRTASRARTSCRSAAGKQSRAGMRVRVGGAFAKVRQAAFRGPVRAGDPLCKRRVLGDADHRAAVANQVPELKSQPGFAQAFMPNGRAPQPGEKFSFPDQARTLRKIAETKGEAFYRGEIAQKIAAFARDHGAALTLDDLASHRPDWVEPIGIDYRGYTLHEIPPTARALRH